MKFDKNGNLIPGKIKYKISHDKIDEEIINNYIQKECNFEIEYDNKENAIFKKKKTKKSRKK